MVAITDSTVRNTVYESVYDLVNTNKSSWVSDTALYGGYPDNEDISFPNIIIMPIDVDEDSYTVDTDRNVSTKMIMVNIEVYSKKNKDLDKISDGLTAMFRANQITGLFLVSVAENTQVVMPNDLKLKSKVLTFTFKRR
jgi:hypothetical protein